MSKSKRKSEKTEKNEEKFNKPLKEDSNAAREGAKYLVTFLVKTSFRGVAYEKGDTLELSKGDPKIKSKRSDLKITRLDK